MLLNDANPGLVPLGLAVLLVACAGGERDAGADGETAEQRLDIVIEGTSVPVPLDAMDVWLSANAKRREPFLVHGPGVAIAGLLPEDVRVDYGEDWHALIGRPIPVSARGGNPGYPQPSFLEAPGIGQYRITGGTLLIEEVGPGEGGRTPLRGRVRLRIRTAGGETTLEGTFAVIGMTWG